ncbi:MAG: hypothetical protein R2757_14030 [Draconibacterium sp.]
MKNGIIFLTLMVVVSIIACNKEKAIKPSADFTTNIQDNTLKAGKNFTVYLKNTSGEFLVYFKGGTEETTYDPSDETRLGTVISSDADSVLVTAYNNPGQYVFTLVASSSGNWGEDYLQDVKSVTINVEAP